MPRTHLLLRVPRAGVILTPAALQSVFLVGGAYVPSFSASASFSSLVIERVFDHPKPCRADMNNDGAINQPGCFRLSACMGVGCSGVRIAG